MRLMLFLCGLFFINFIYADNFILSSHDLKNKINVPNKFTCIGGNISPALNWQNAPAATQSFVVIVVDPDAPKGNWYHWIVYNIPVNINKLAQDIKQLPEGAQTLPNSWGKPGYSGPCPPAGSVHHYQFIIYALDKTLKVKNLTELKEELAKHTLASSEIVEMFGK